MKLVSVSLLGTILVVKPMYMYPFGQGMLGMISDLWRISKFHLI